ncbi:hypothetical protein GCM10007414_07870 [Agarivorans gilvus]|uniref:Uncharacterized protein n=1 Tax=Agarivorans gilvus TaxID=680279 RepID=A0ABQ1HXR7_9ALTE|nr:hypothetical protein GCM10007414_07870 [Agarivorans gilvus]
MGLASTAAKQGRQMSKLCGLISNMAQGKAQLRQKINPSRAASRQAWRQQGRKLTTLPANP